MFGRLIDSEMLKEEPSYVDKWVVEMLKEEPSCIDTWAAEMLKEEPSYVMPESIVV